MHFAKVGHCPYRDPVTLRHSTMESSLLACRPGWPWGWPEYLLPSCPFPVGSWHSSSFFFFLCCFKNYCLRSLFVSSILCFPKISKPSNKILSELENKCIFFYFKIEISSSLFQFFFIFILARVTEISGGLSLLDVSSPFCLVCLSKLTESLFLFPPAEIQS